MRHRRMLIIIVMVLVLSFSFIDNANTAACRFVQIDNGEHFWNGVLVGCRTVSSSFTLDAVPEGVGVSGSFSVSQTVCTYRFKGGYTMDYDINWVDRC